MEERELITYPIWEHYTVLSTSIHRLSIRDRRYIFQIMRRTPVTPDLLFPRYGFTMSEFATWHILNDMRRKTRRNPKRDQETKST